LREANIPILGQWMIGMPGETPLLALKSIQLSLELGDIPQVHIATPFPKTRLRELAIERGILRADEPVSLRSIYDDFTMVEQSQLPIFRLLYNLFNLQNQRIALSEKNGIFDRAFFSLRNAPDKRIGALLLRDVKL
jgi:radical SAM superfamily enzyme YgiQ (UPF0313 family)